MLLAAREQRERARWLTDERSLRLTYVRKAVSQYGYAAHGSTDPRTFYPVFWPELTTEMTG